MSSKAFFDVADEEGNDLLEDLKQMVRLGEAERPRSQQKEIGPSGLGEPCPRKLGYMMSSAPKCGGHRDPLRALFGVGMHLLMEDFALAANRRLGRLRWIPEQRIEVYPGIFGTCDLYDIDTGTVIDTKCPGPSRFKLYTGKKGPSLVYRRQIQIYGYGYERTYGVRPNNVAIFFLPVANDLFNARLWKTPYDPQAAEEVFEHYARMKTALAELDTAHHPERFAQIPMLPSDDCRICDYWSPIPQNNFQCIGNAEELTPPE